MTVRTNPDSPTPPREVDEATPEAALPGFKSPRQVPKDGPPDPATTTTWATDQERLAEAMRAEGATEAEIQAATLAEPPSAADEGDELDGPEIPKTQGSGSSRASSSERLEVAGAMAELVGTAFGMVALTLHQRLTPGDNPLWIPTDEEVTAVAVPLGRIASRRVPIGGGQATDLADGIGAAVAVAGFAVTNLRRQAEYRVWLQQQEQVREGAGG